MSMEQQIIDVLNQYYDPNLEVIIVHPTDFDHLLLEAMKQGNPTYALNHKATIFGLQVIADEDFVNEGEFILATGRYKFAQQEGTPQ